MDLNYLIIFVNYIKQEELTEDLIQIITVFSCKLQGKRAKTTKKMIKELEKEDDLSEKEN